ncbi:MAG TPA: T9SS type A sorting domain-containing protein, partial [Flavobacteriales bacterium]|nr:T9SS type A sorting domain-containing protein [Flavobacteriales bacterium]
VAITDLTTGIDDLEGSTEALSVWPNPATDRLTIALPSTNARTAEVLDASGRVVLTSPVRVTNNTLDVSALSSGAYTVRLTGGEGVRTARFVKH